MPLMCIGDYSCLFLKSQKPNIVLVTSHMGGQAFDKKAACKTTHQTWIQI